MFRWNSQIFRKKCCFWTSRQPVESSGINAVYNRWKTYLRHFVSLRRNFAYEPNQRWRMWQGIRIFWLPTICIHFDFTGVKRAIISVQNHIFRRFLSTNLRRVKKVLKLSLLTIADVKEHKKVHLIHVIPEVKKIWNIDL